MIYKIIKLSGLPGIILLMCFIQGCNCSGDDISRAVRKQLKQYPESRLMDIYKSFFQDEFGPGHMINDTLGAWQYLESELSEMKSKGNHEVEACGTGRNFYRVPLDLVKDGIISDTVLFKTFIQSSASFRKPDIESWKKKWEEIVATIDRMNLGLANYEQDKKDLAGMLDKGETVVHHSQEYEEIYHPHYRIVKKEEWERVPFSR